MIRNVLILFTLLVSTLGFSQAKTLTKEQYRDKTLAMILGSLGGVLTGYEYLNVYDTPNGFYAPGAALKLPKEPLLCLPEDWFILLNGTLGGTTKDEHHYGSWIAGPGRVNSDDDQHIDFFNQWLLNQYGLTISYEDIKHEWMTKEVSDFGGGQGAIEVMRDKDLMAPQCGHRDHGNTGHWLPECYIEHEMMGAAFPGLPKKAIEYTEKFSSITGEGENVQWGCYWAAAHSIAYFETDSRVAVEKAVELMPGNSRVRQMYDICKALKNKYPNDWRPAVRELWKNHWRAPFAVGHDKVMMLGDVNNGTGFLSILYGNNDYMEVLKISSLAGGDGDCTASAVVGMMGIIKGLAGTPQKFKDDIWANGNGVWINDVVHAFSIKKDYKLEWRYNELVDMFMQNAEMVIRAYGGNVSANGYLIQPGETNIPQITSENWDFENGDLSGWKIWRAGGPSGIWNERQCNDATQACYAATGQYKGTILTESNTAEAKLYQTITGLTPGKTYRIEGRVHTANGRQARLYAENYGGPYQYASIFRGVSPFPYMYLYVTMGPGNATMDVGLHAVPTDNPGKWCSIDDIIITEVEKPLNIVRYEAEQASVINQAQIVTSASASGGQYVGYINEPGESYIRFDTVYAAYEGEHILRINYANEGAFAQHRIEVNGKYVGLMEHSDTGPWGGFSSNVTDAWVKLQEGPNVVKISAHKDFAEIDYIDVLSPYGTEGRPFTDADIVNGGIYAIFSRKSGKAITVDGDVANGTALSQQSYEGMNTQLFRITKIAGVYTIEPLNSQQSLEIPSFGMDNGNPVKLWGSWQGDTQKWAILDVGGGYFKIINHNSGKAMDVAGGRLTDGAEIIQWDYLNATNQQWDFKFIGNNVATLPHNLPGSFQAEAYSAQQGIGKEPTTDNGGGENIMDLDIGEWVDYAVHVATGGAYEMDFRVASATAGGILEILSGTKILNTIYVNGTGGWQNWQTVSARVELPQGLQTLRLRFSGTEANLFNINWVEAKPWIDCSGEEYGTALEDACGACTGGNTGIEPETDPQNCVITGKINQDLSVTRVYPNPFSNIIHLERVSGAGLQLFNAAGELVLEQKQARENLDLSMLPQGIYLLRLHTQSGARTFKLQKK